MSFNRLDYDKCAYAKSLEESTTPLEYWLFLGKYENCTQCPKGCCTNNLDLSVRTEVESELWNIDRVSTKCPSKKYNPKDPITLPKYTPPRVCDTIYYITPNNLEKPKSNGLDYSKLGRSGCEKKKRN